jgi:hypothetical protein
MVDGQWFLDMEARKKQMAQVLPDELQVFSQRTKFPYPIRLQIILIVFK